MMMSHQPKGERREQTLDQPLEQPLEAQVAKQGKEDNYLENNAELQQLLKEGKYPELYDEMNSLRPDNYFSGLILRSHVFEYEAILRITSPNGVKTANTVKSLKMSSKNSERTTWKGISLPMLLIIHHQVLPSPPYGIASVTSRPLLSFPSIVTSAIA